MAKKNEMLKTNPWGPDQFIISNGFRYGYNSVRQGKEWIIDRVFIPGGKSMFYEAFMQLNPKAQKPLWVRPEDTHV